MANGHAVGAGISTAGFPEPPLTCVSSLIKSVHALPGGRAGLQAGVKVRSSL
jgi:hypothetical protein